MESLSEEVADAQRSPLSVSVSAGERRKHLRSLFITLARDEVRLFRQWTDEVDFRHDLLANFPLEITQQILGYLPLHQCFRMRRVSKEWFRILSGPQTVRYLLRFWYPRAQVKLEIPKGVIASAVSSSRAEYVDAYRSGRAFSMVKGARNLTNRLSTKTSIAYSNGYIAWIDSTNRLHRLHLESGSSKYMSPPEGEVFSHVALSSSTTVVTTDGGECQVMQHIDNEIQKFLLATSAVEKIYASGNTVVILHSPSQEDRTQVQLTLYMIESKQVVHCRVRAQGLPLWGIVRHQMNIIIGTSEDYLVLFETWLEPGQCRHFCFTRFSLDEQIQSQGSLQERFTDNSTASLNSPMALDVNGRITIWSYRNIYWEARPTELMRVQYDPQHNNLQVKMDLIKLGLPWYNEKAFFWKDVAYLRNQDTRITYVIDLSKDEPEFCTTMEIFDKSLLRSLMNTHRHLELAKTPILGDGNFIITVYPGGCLAWCFNKDIKLADEDEDYARHRRDNLRKRLERQRTREAKAIEHISGQKEIDLRVA